MRTSRAAGDGPARAPQPYAAATIGYTAPATVYACTPDRDAPAYGNPGHAHPAAGYSQPTQRHDTIALARIDGKSPRNPRKSDPLTPGKHSIEVSYSTARAVVTDDLKMLDLEMEPCKRYRIVAHHESDRSPKWAPVVQQVEDIGECKRKFMSDKTKK